jgi:hypothetical protein
MDGARFKSAALAQPVEQPFRKWQVESSILSRGSIILVDLRQIQLVQSIQITIIRMD